MRMHIELDDDLVAQVDRIAGPRGRSGFVRTAVERAVRQEIRWSSIVAAARAPHDAVHARDAATAGWVRDQRRPDARRAG